MRDSVSPFRWYLRIDTQTFLGPCPKSLEVSEKLSLGFGSGQSFIFLYIRTSVGTDETDIPNSYGKGLTPS